MSTMQAREWSTEREAQEKRSPLLIALHHDICAAMYVAKGERREMLENLSIGLYAAIQDGAEVTPEYAQEARAIYLEGAK